jgi:hypothetical protein
LNAIVPRWIGARTLAATSPIRSIASFHIKPRRVSERILGPVGYCNCKIASFLIFMQGRT